MKPSSPTTHLSHPGLRRRLLLKWIGTSLLASPFLHGAATASERRDATHVTNRTYTVQNGWILKPEDIDETLARD